MKADIVDIKRTEAESGKMTKNKLGFVLFRDLSQGLALMSKSENMLGWRTISAVSFFL